MCFTSDLISLQVEASQVHKSVVRASYANLKFIFWNLGLESESLQENW